MSLGYILYDASHPFDWRVDSRTQITSLALVTQYPIDFESTRFINVTSELRFDGGSNIRFDLIDYQYSLMFDAFCRTLIEDSRNFEPNLAGVKHILRLYNNWKRMFTGPKKLELREIRGLIGELAFLRNYMFPKYGQSVSLQAWMNLKFGKQDFIVDSTWFEVKTATTDAQTVRISSLDQLDRRSAGILAVVFLSKSSSVSDSAVTLNSMFRDVRDSFESDLDRDLFVQIMTSIGYSEKPAYDEHVFEISSIRRFSVQDDFPRLCRSTLNIPGISNAEYDILIQSITKYEVI